MRTRSTRLGRWLGRLLSPQQPSASTSTAELAARKMSVEQEFGPWTAHNCRLAEGLFTLRSESVNFDEKTRRCLRIAQDFFGSDLSGLRVLDLGAGEGGLSLEFAAHGATVVCVEGRRNNIAKAQFAASALGLKIEFRCEDVRTLRADQPYDLVLCFGLLYHLDARSAVRLVETIGRISGRLFILDTHFSPAGAETISLEEEILRGHTFREHPEGSTSEVMAAPPWASLENDTSFWLSKPSLLNLMTRAGFNTVYEVAAPLVFDYWDRKSEARMRYRDRATFVAAKSIGAPLRTATAGNAVAPRPVPEDLEAQLVTYPPENR